MKYLIFYCVRTLICMSFLECCELDYLNPFDELCAQIPHHRSKRAGIFDIDADTIRDIITNGIPAFNITTLDPLTLPDTYDVELPPASGVMTVNELHLENVTLTGLGGFVSNKFEVSIRTIPIVPFEFDLSFFLNATADYIKLDLLIGDMIPLYGDGTLELGIDNLRLNGKLVLHVSTPVTITTMDVAVSIDGTEFDISNIMYMGGTQYARTFNRVMSETTPQILGFSLDGLVAQIKDLVNNYTTENNISLNNLLGYANP
ncbi:hypothetical protein L9F63_017613 [Diploptera punctata]|uniref:Uncharacterized protein n=1 Tax=Diploptera punctata TaxID=6984 RepID=A0AAD8EGJ8_DIPPU|nr:hypothetical protein L9F63_017613 [Diploptera punctata]